MRTPDGHGDSRDAEPQAPGEAAKKPYRAPRLVSYGSLPQLALAKGGNRADGPGAPVSKV
jgi:hypothetical protein